MTGLPDIVCSHRANVPGPELTLRCMKGWDKDGVLAGFPSSSSCD